MYVRAKMIEGQRTQAILAPQQGISRDARGRATAMVVGKDNKAEMRQVTVDRAVGDKWIVTSGLKAGDRLIVEGLQRVRPDQVVRPMAAGSKPAGAAGRASGAASAGASGPGSAAGPAPGGATAAVPDTIPVIRVRVAEK